VEAGVIWGYEKGTKSQMRQQDMVSRSARRELESDNAGRDQ
jgi:hypothetical protein